MTPNDTPHFTVDATLYGEIPKVAAVLTGWVKMEEKLNRH